MALLYAYSRLLVARILSKRTQRKIWANWGHIALPVTIWGWIVGLFGAPFVLAASALMMGFFMLQAKVPCGAEIRERNRETGEHLLCRNDAYGLLRGCKQFTAHKWGNAKLLVDRSRWGRLFRSLIRERSGQATAIGSLANVGVMVGTFGTMIVTIIQ